MRDTLTTLSGFQVRQPRAEELPAITPWFADSQLGLAQSMVRVAFGQPSEIPLGAVIVRPSNGGKVGQFTIYVRPDWRRRGIGRFLVNHLYQLALGNNAEMLVLVELVHQDDPAIAFCRAVGLSPDLQLGTYELDIAEQVLPVCDRVVRRFADSHPHLRDTRVTTLSEVDLEAVAAFLTTHYSGFVERQTERLREGFFDRALTTVAVHASGAISGVAFIVTKPDTSAILLDLVLTEPAIRNGPTPLVLFAETSRRALAAGRSTAVFEGDARHDPFAVGFAARCGVTSPRWYRYRFSISRAEMMTAR